MFFRQLSGVLRFLRHQFSFRPQVPCLLSYWLRCAFSLLQLYKCTAPSLPLSRVFCQVIHCMLLLVQPNEWKILNQGSNISCNNYCQYVNKQRKTKQKTGETPFICHSRTTCSYYLQMRNGQIWLNLIHLQLPCRTPIYKGGIRRSHTCTFSDNV